MASRKKIKVFLFIILQCLFITPAVFPQNSQPEKEIQAAFDQYKSRFIVEKLFVHTDKDSYFSREICWFRIYYTDAFSNRPASISKIAYVEILDRNNQPLLQQKVSLKPGESDGSIIIPVSISSGIYR